MRPRQYLVLGILLLFSLCWMSLFKLTSSLYKCSFVQLQGDQGTKENHSGSSPAAASSESTHSPGPFRHILSEVDVLAGSQQPLPATGKKHPIWALIGQAKADHESVVARQSSTLAEAMAEYRRRYQMPPPPGFDKWFSFARSKGVVLVDEFDDVHDMLRPFWGLSPVTIRRRTREVLGNAENMLLGVLIRGGSITHIGGGQPWMQESFRRMIGNFSNGLGDVDLDIAINLHDEPRVLVPSEDLERLIQKGKNAIRRLNGKDKKVSAKWSKMKDMIIGDRFEQVTGTRFTVMHQQQTWITSRMSCPVDSPARADLDNDAFTPSASCLYSECASKDKKSHFAISRLGLLHNMTAHADPCIHPTLAEKHGLFSGAHAFSVSHELVAIFSHSKPQNFQDLLVPSQWYYNDNAKYEEWRDPIWEEKRNVLFWRGSTTGGFAIKDNWRKSHRMRFVDRINSISISSREQILYPNSSGFGWSTGPLSSALAESLSSNNIDVQFSEINQCESAGCSSMREHFPIFHYEDRQQAWNSRYLLDMDGNAYSGRFYAFLRSRSMVFKMSIFKEWHDNWLRPWLHFIPLSLDGDDWVEVIRFFTSGTKQEEAKHLSGKKQDWALQALRKEDMETWFYRMLLEYARVVDDRREELGYNG